MVARAGQIFMQTPNECLHANPTCFIAWYDYDLKSYQTDRMDSELERVFEEKVDSENAILHKSKFGDYVAKPVSYQEETEWQRIAREKNAGERIKELEDEQRLRGRGKESHMFAHPALLAQQQSLAKGMASKYEENLAEEKLTEDRPSTPKLNRKIRSPEQATEDQTKESREAQLKRQQQRQEQLMQQRLIAEEERRQEQIRKQQEQQEFLKQKQDQQVLMQREIEPSESSVHGKEIHTSVQKQSQKEIQGDLEIHRKITTTEKTEMEHKGKTTERVVQGPVEPANPPFFTKKIQPCRAFEKEGARFEVEFEGEPRPTVQWYREDFPITSSPDFQIHTFGDKSILLIREVFMEDSGVFAVVAENKVGRAKCSANLVVEERKQSRAGIVPPSFISTIQDVKMKVGSLVRLDAKIHGTQPIDVYWLKDGQKLQEDNRCKMIVEEGINTMLILEAIPGDTGSYECVAINKAGEARCQADVAVKGDTPASTPSAPKGSKQAPAIIEKLKGQIVQEGQAARFECAVTGEPTPTVQWLKGNQPIKQSKYFSMTADEGRYVLKISEAFPEDEGTYKCILKNSVGKVELEAPLKVTQPQQVDVPPALTQMKGVTVQEGDSVVFTTTMSGKPVPKVQWYREGTLIPSTPDFQMAIKGNVASLAITETYPEDTGTFTCRATNPAGQAETSALLTVQRRQEEVPRGEHPLFYEVLQPANIKHGEKAVFKAKVRGHPPPKILWYHGDKELPVSEDFLQEFHVPTGTVQLTIKEVFIDDRGLYKAVAINEYGKDETTGYLSVEDLEVLEKSDLRQAPRIIVPLEAQVLPLGSPVVMRAKYEAFPPPTIKWYKETKEIKPSIEFIIENTEDETSLQITELYDDDYGEYQVRVFNEAGEARSAASVVVIHPRHKPEVEDLQPPKFIKTLNPQIVPEGEVAILEAEVTAKPEADFMWFRHGQRIETNEELEVTVTSGNNKSSLVINELFEDDSGDYTVTATNPVGKASSTATLLVEGEEVEEECIAPEFCPPLTPLRVMDGEQVRYTCRVKAKPTPRISWYHNGRPIDHHREVKVLQTPDGRVGLLISEVFPEDAGDYTCIARNKAGEARCTTSLAVESYEYHADSEAATLASVSDKQILSGTASEDEILDIDKDSESDSEAGTSPFFSNKLETRFEVQEGTPVRFVAKAEGYPKPNIIWYADEKPIESCEEINLENFEDGTVALNIPYTILDHCGIYICEAMNRNGIDTTATQLVVLPQGL